ncbi:hypothetical protein WH47_03793 [Habropoda laboriosa]|uniref:Uncharacterized protein n=1 Tax=Habropoda laboriosa TaxID=597456 RepID=A0A0L7QUT9_9HYME|nr:hypothetical protein WH47_03793 [Habropoda laboriosa]
MIIRCDQGTDNEHTEKDSSDSNLFVANTSKQHKKQNKNPNNTTDFKSIIIKFEEKIKNKFSQFQQFMYRSELKYFKDDKATLQDAIDILFIFNCFISKLKEELTEQQQDLANVCIEWSTQHECNCIVPNIQDKECVNGNNLQVQNGTSSQCNSSSSEILSGNILKQNSLKTIDRSTINVHKRDKTVILQQNIQNNKDELPLEASNNSAHIREDANSNVTFRSSKRLMNTVTTLAEINKSKTPEKGPVVNSKIPKNTKNSTPNPKAMNQDFVEILELLSRSDSDSSDNELTLIRNQLRNYDSHDKCKNSLTDMHEIRQGNESRSLLSEICNEEINDDVRTQASYNSDDTIIIPRKKSFNSRIQISENEDENCSETTTQIYVDSANTENSIFQQQSQFVIPNINNLNTKYYFRSNRNSGNFRPKTSSINKRKTDITDKKLQMNCKVLINKC